MTYKYFRLKGCTICIIFAYFDCSIGLKAENLHNINRIDALRDEGRVHTIVVADLNVKPEEWSTGKYLEKLDAAIMLPGNAATTFRTA